jgi:hypothetical protein
VIRKLCEECNKNTFYTLKDQSGCVNWDCAKKNMDWACNYKDEIEDFLFEKLDFCGCGDNDSSYKFINDLLNLKINYKISRADKELSFSEDMRIVKQYLDDVKNLIQNNAGGAVMWIIEYMLDDKKITDHGGNVSGSWLSDYYFKEALEIHIENISE